MNFTKTVILSSFGEPVVLSECKKKGGLSVVDESAGGRSAAETGSRITQLSRSSGHSMSCRAAESECGCTGSREHSVSESITIL